MGAVGIDMQEPLRENMDAILANDKIHPNAEGARIIAEATFAAMEKGSDAGIRQLDANRDFPCSWVAREYPRRRGNMDEGHWWPVSKMYDCGIKRIKGVPLDGILWYQGESNATTCVKPDIPTPKAYQEETLRAVVAELRGEKRIPFIMMGLPKMNRPWEPYRDIQRKVCEDTGAIYVDTF